MIALLTYAGLGIVWYYHMLAYLIAAVIVFSPLLHTTFLVHLELEHMWRQVDIYIYIIAILLHTCRHSSD